MKSQVNFIYDTEDDPLDELKHWYFLENVRIQQEKQEIEETKKILEKERKELMELKAENDRLNMIKEQKLTKDKALFDKQFKILERELKRFADDKNALEKEKAYIEKERENLRLDRGKTKPIACDTNIFFYGVNNFLSLKKRYRELIKIYHPDNMGGNNNILLSINKEYERLKEVYGIKEII